MRGKMKKSFKVVPLLIALASVFTVALAVPASAQQAGGGTNGLRISPVRTDITVSPGGSQTVAISIQNVTSQTVTLKGVTDDFVASTDETGTPRLILNDNQYAPSHSLKRFVSPIHNITLAPNQQEVVQVSVTVPKDAAGGGYYGAVRFLPATNDSSKSVSLSASVGSLILLKVPGNVKELVSVASFQTRQNYSATNEGSAGAFFTTNKHISLVTRFQNEGNIQEQPFGKVILKKGGKTLESVEINNTTPRGNILPDSIRKFNVPLSKVGSFGKYSVEGAFGYGTNGQLLTAKSTFYVIPVAIIIIAVIIIALIVFAIFGLPRMIRSHDSRIIRRSRRGNSK
jgi:hypothetical protein